MDIYDTYAHFPENREKAAAALERARAAGVARRRPARRDPLLHGLPRLVHTVKFLADLRSIPAEELAARTFANAVSLFGC